MHKLLVGHRQRGVSLVEILVSIAVGLFILAGVVQLYATTTQNSSMVRGNSSIQEHVRFIFARIENDVANAGYAGCLNFKAGVSRVFNIAAQTSTPAFTLDRFVTGDNDVAINGKTFDQLIVRYAGSRGRTPVLEVNSDNFKVASSASGDFTQGDFVVAGDCSSVGVFRVSNNPGATGVVKFETGSYNTGAFAVEFSDSNDLLPAITYLYSGSGAYLYYVDTSTSGGAAGETCSAAKPEHCALYRKSSNEASAAELVEGVESFEVEYGWRDATGNLFFANAAAVPAVAWTAIDRVRITTTLSSQNKTATADGIDFLQKSFSRTFFFFNQIPEV